jgi:hypothetical protein
VAASFGSLNNDGIHTRRGRTLRLCQALHLGKDAHPARLRHRDIGRWIGKGVIDHGYLLVKGNLDKVINVWE